MNIKKLIAVILSAALLITIGTPVVFADDSQRDIEIVNPYESIDWETYETYKACLHTHTNASDGDVDLKTWLQLYYDADYDIIAITDHGVISNGWDKPKQTNGIFNGFRKVYPLTKEEYDYFTKGVDRDSRGMVDITGGIECSMATISKTHVNGYFTTYGQGVWGKENDYETAPRMIEQAGGYSVLNHVGDWVNSNNYPDRSHNPFYINYFANIFTKYKTCLGMEIVNSWDNISKGDRDLWDELLQVVIPTGRNIWAFADDDAEKPDAIGTAFELFPLEENNVETVKQAMIDGAFFSASKYYKTTSRLGEIYGDGLVPIVTNIVVDGSTITVECDEERGCDVIEWISDGKVIKTDDSGSLKYTIDLNDYEDLGCYVRFQLKSEDHGVTYSQAFELKYDGRPEKEIPESPIKDNAFGKLFWSLYQRIGVALVQFIGEKILNKMGVIPKIY